ncbi:MAG: glycosyltransferase family 2 protein [Bacteroidetes bacterium]|nr:glycosyltransferase family 2 protein [Bacteroidota bacterium]
MNHTRLSYIVVTPTKNEGKYIEETIKSIINQEHLPVEWFIMDDDSNDNTCELVKKYSDNYSFIKYIRLSSFRSELVNTGGRVAAIINYADSLRVESADIIAKIDADTSFDKDFFSNIIHEFEKNPSLGVASGHLVENGVPEKVKDRTSGRGASLIIRYNCFSQIGKFYESKTRGEDVLAVVAARAKGWETWTFDIYFNHLKPEGIRKSKLKNHYVTGFYKGSIPYWLPFFVGNLARDTFKKPYFIGSLLQLYSYCLSRYILKYRPFPDFVAEQFILEQKTKFKKIISFK